MALIMGNRFHFLYLLISVFVICTGCDEYVSIQPDWEALPVELSEAELPPGWTSGLVTVEAEWGQLDRAYAISYSASFESLRLVARLVYRQYPDDDLADYHYREHFDAIFYRFGEASWSPSEIHHVMTSQEYSFMCTSIGSIPIRSHCSYWAKYNNCIIEFSSNLHEVLMSHEQFITLILALDRKMNNVGVCHNL